MNAASLGPYQVLALSRTIALCPDPIMLFADACDNGRRENCLLLESAEPSIARGDASSARGAKSLVLTQAALRLTGRGHKVEIVALTKNGQGLIKWLTETLADRATITATSERLIADFEGPSEHENERERLMAPSVLDTIRQCVLNLEIVGGKPAIAPMVAGSLAYDLLGVYEPLPEPRRDENKWPDFELWLAEELIWIQHATGRTAVLRYVFGGPHAEAAYNDATSALAARVARCEKLGPRSTAPPNNKITDRSVLAEPDCDMDNKTFIDLVDTLKKHIVAGDVFQVVPSRTFSLPCADPLRAYRHLRELNPSPYMFYMASSAGTLFGASPEAALTVSAGSGDTATMRVKMSPIAGTRARGRHVDGSIDADLDARIEAELRLDEKEVAEHMMLVDLARNDVARVSRAGSRRIDQLLQVVRYSHVMHLVSTVSGELRSELDALHAYLATMNMGTLVGAPKIEAASLLRKHEPSRRGPYGGAVGYLDSMGELDTCIVIRSALVQQGRAHVRAGCGVVYDSDPRAEAEETRKKANAVLLALCRAHAGGPS